MDPLRSCFLSFLDDSLMLDKPKDLPSTPVVHLHKGIPGRNIRNGCHIETWSKTGFHWGSPARSDFATKHLAANYETTGHTVVMTKRPLTVCRMDPFWDANGTQKWSQYGILLMTVHCFFWVARLSFNAPETTTSWTEMRPSRETLHWLNHHKDHDCRFLT